VAKALSVHRSRYIDLRRLKEFALEKLPDSSTLRHVLVAEKDSLDVGEFFAKIDVWLKILRREKI